MAWLWFCRSRPPESDRSTSPIGVQTVETVDWDPMTDPIGPSVTPTKPHHVVTFDLDSLGPAKTPERAIDRLLQARSRMNATIQSAFEELRTSTTPTKLEDVSVTTQVSQDLIGPIQAFQQLNMDNSTYILTREELQEAKSKHLLTDVMKAALGDKLHLIDRDGDGEVSVDEFMDAMDVNGNGSISVNEFCNQIKRFRNADLPISPASPPQARTPMRAWGNDSQVPAPSPGRTTVSHSKKDLLDAANKLHADVGSAVTAAATNVSLPNVIPEPEPRSEKAVPGQFQEFTDLDDVVNL
jgi:hypothetical protein